MYLLLAFVLGLIAFCSTVSWKDFGETVVGGIISGVITFALSWLIMWWNQPVVSLSYGVWIPYMTIPALIVLIVRYVTYWDYDQDFTFTAKIPCYILLGGLLFGLFTSTGIGRSSKMQKMLEVTETSDSAAYCRDVARIQPESMILVDDELASKYAQVKLEQDASTGSVCEIRGLSLQNLNGTFNVRLADGQNRVLTFNNEQVYVAPLEHRGFFKWNRNRYTPGYILVSATKQDVAYFVTHVNGEPLELRYLGSACFGEYWKRYLRHNGYSNVRFADCNIELNDEGIPFMVVPVRENTRSYTCPEITKVITLNVQTGAIEEYSLQDLPGWIDRVYPSGMIKKRIDWWGKYENGWWNSQFGEIGVRKPTPGIGQVYTDGSCYWYTGIQSSGKDDGTSGFMLVNTRTGKSKLYPISGVNEKSCKDKLSELYIDRAQIHPSDLLMYNLENVPTYFTTCKLESGEFLGYAFASVQDRNVYGKDADLYDAYENYCKALRSSHRTLQLEGEVTREKKSFVVAKKTYENGDYYFIFQGEPKKEYKCPSNISLEAKWTEISDTVFVTFDEGKSSQIRLKSFDNPKYELEMIRP